MGGVMVGQLMFLGALCLVFLFFILIGFLQNESDKIDYERRYDIWFEGVKESEKLLEEGHWSFEELLDIYERHYYRTLSQARLSMFNPDPEIERLRTLGILDGLRYHEQRSKE